MRPILAATHYSSLFFILFRYVLILMHSVVRYRTCIC